MQDYSLPIFDEARKWIKVSREHKVEWSDIFLARKKDEDGLKQFLEQQTDMNFWPELSITDWNNLVKLEQTAEEKTKFIDISKGTALIYDKKQDNAVTIPTDEFSSWQLYRSKLIHDGFKEESVEEIERATIKVLKRLNNNTTESGPVKGLVIGNVQSGKTANMAALMAMAADWGWNMFIILSGTIENLRMQTQTRLFNDLNQQGNIFWNPLEHLAKNVDLGKRTQDLHFDENSKTRYFTVCLKNSTRLKNLIEWSQADKNKQRQMKILVIDDEADQAGINTGHVDDEEERRRISKLICSLVNGKDADGNDIDTKYHAMNYIGYTATPYANILNEAGENSLYPRNFISTLAVSKEYFGPQQIFGYSGDNVEFEGMDIVRTISENELQDLRNIHDGNQYKIPGALIDAVAWFLCGVSCMRIWGYKKPISMLVHTSQKTAHHQNIADVINNWFDSNSDDEIVRKAEQIWISETKRFSIKEFREQYPDYDRKDEEINRYPKFSEIEKEIRIILQDGISNIKMDDDGELKYHKGIHLCIDNCMNNGITDGMHIRLAYPEADKVPSPAPAFIVIGGATLSRGLTLEGLISTFFIRSVGQADTLMQMGRWFGYRKNYELLPRVWMTKKTKEQFEFLAALDQELRDEIQYMDVNGRSPAEYGPKVKNSPKVSFIRITAKNRMQSATDASMDYSGASNQTYLFDNDADVLRYNIDITQKFIAGLGDEWISDDEYHYHDNAAVWRNVSFEMIRTYIEKFKFQERLGVFNDIKPLLDWIDSVTRLGKLGDWNVVVAGKKDNTNGTWTLPNGRVINKVKRSKKKTKNELEDTIINIGALRDPRDLLTDIDVESISNPTIKEEVLSYIASGESKSAMAYRDKSGLEITPQLLIYRVDKDSKAKGAGLTRVDLNAPEDLIGICLYIPGGRIGTSYASTISIKMSNDVFDGDADLEGTDAD